MDTFEQVVVITLHLCNLPYILQHMELIHGGIHGAPGAIVVLSVPDSITIIVELCLY